MSDKGHWSVIDNDGAEIAKYETAEEAEAFADGCNGPLLPGIDSNCDYKWVDE